MYSRTARIASDIVGAICVSATDSSESTEDSRDVTDESSPVPTVCQSLESSSSVSEASRAPSRAGGGCRWDGDRMSDGVGGWDCCDAGRSNDAITTGFNARSWFGGEGNAFRKSRIVLSTGGAAWDEPNREYNEHALEHGEVMLGDVGWCTSSILAAG